MKKINMILAVDSKNGLWKKWDLAWKISHDLKIFKEITSKTKDLAKMNAIIMWKKTWESLPSKFRPLSNRINCILSRSIKQESINSKIGDFVLYFNSIDSCIQELLTKTNLENIFVIWWANIYNQFLNHSRLDRIYLTKIDNNFEGDTHFPEINFSDWRLLDSSKTYSENNLNFRFMIYKRSNLRYRRDDRDLWAVLWNVSQLPGLSRKRHRWAWENCQG